MGEIRSVGTGETRGYPYLVCKKEVSYMSSEPVLYSQTSIIRSVRDCQIFFELSVIRIFEIGTFRKYSVVFVWY